MPLKINAGVGRKLGLPAYSSVSASCHIEFEADHDLLNDPESLQQRVKAAYAACRDAVATELARQQQADNTAPANNHVIGNGNGHQNSNGNGHAPARRSGGRRATASQARALHAIADRQHLDLAAELRRRFGVESPEDLSITEASQTIDELKATTNGNGR